MISYQNSIYKIGHSNHLATFLLDLLKRHKIDEVIDVRSVPYSRYVPHFNHKNLEDLLFDEDIGYEFLGDQLGVHPYIRADYDYDLTIETESFQDGLQTVINRADDRRVALLCAEKDPINCHRTLLVAHTLTKRGLDIQHIYSDGSLVSHQELVAPLGTLFKTIDQAVKEEMGIRAREATRDKEVHQGLSVEP